MKAAASLRFSKRTSRARWECLPPRRRRTIEAAGRGVAGGAIVRRLRRSLSRSIGTPYALLRHALNWRERQPVRSHIPALSAGKCERDRGLSRGRARGGGARGSGSGDQTSRTISAIGARIASPIRSTPAAIGEDVAGVVEGVADAPVHRRPCSGGTTPAPWSVTIRSDTSDIEARLWRCSSEARIEAWRRRSSRSRASTDSRSASVSTLAELLQQSFDRGVRVAQFFGHADGRRGDVVGRVVARAHFGDLRECRRARRRACGSGSAARTTPRSARPCRFRPRS